MKPLIIAITGHRPKDLLVAGRPMVVAPTILDMLGRAAQRAKDAETDKVRVITGGALGIDQEVADAVLRQPSKDGIAFSYAVFLPFPAEVMGKRWPPTDRDRLARLIEGADEVRVIGETFAMWHYQERNEAMVDVADMLVGFWTGKRSGGTWNCLRYALRVGKPTFNAMDGFRRLRPEQLGVRIARSEKG